MIALGANLGDRRAQLEQAVCRLGEHPEIRVDRVSSWHETPPVGGPSGQQGFLNGAARLATSLEPESLLAVLKNIEQQAGRERRERWGPRPLDLDLLLYGERVVCTPDLVVPHPRMSFRRFVLEPAAEIAGEMRDPQSGWTVRQLLTHLDSAPEYVAIAAPPLVKTASLAEFLSRRFDARLLLLGELQREPGAGGSVAAGESGATGSLPTNSGKGQTIHRRLESGLEGHLTLLRTAAARLAAALNSQHASARPKLVVSDFWLGELLANARSQLRGRDSSRFEEVYREVAYGIARPELLVVLRFSTQAAFDEHLQRRDLSAGAERKIVAAARSWSEVLAQQGGGPCLRLDAEHAPPHEEEAAAAVLAMRG